MKPLTAPALVFALALAAALALKAEAGPDLFAAGKSPKTEPHPKNSIAEAREKASRLAKSLDVQTELPKDQSKVPPAPPKESFFLSFLVKVVFVAVVGGIAIVVSRAVAHHLKARKKPAAIEEKAPAPLAKSLDRIGLQSRELAQAGFFAEAIHELLLKSLKEFQKARGLTFAPSLTSREILRGLKLGPPVEPALAFLVELVEVSRFGHFQPQATDYQASLRRFDEIVAGLKGGPGA
ncbi:MAG: DUF4129 domain-containing protein [Deltaproteobacteria bacterium]|jgi:hypothetical protein|nr:DUF4129 domain-containing protein [Deltaproteobacteria bacterium]